MPKSYVFDLIISEKRIFFRIMYANCQMRVKYSKKKDTLSKVSLKKQTIREPLCEETWNDFYRRLFLMDQGMDALSVICKDYFESIRGFQVFAKSLLSAMEISTPRISWILVMNSVVGVTLPLSILSIW